MEQDTAAKGMRDRPAAVVGLRERVASCLGERAGSLGRLGVRSVSLVGSLARREERPDTDVDLLVDLAPDATFDLVTLKEELAAELGREVDILFKGALCAYVAKAVERGALRLLSA